VLEEYTPCRIGRIVSHVSLLENLALGHLGLCLALGMREEADIAGQTRKRK
jgi:hypothetical protein